MQWKENCKYLLSRGLSSGRSLLVIVLLGYFATVSAKVAQDGWLAGWRMVLVHSARPSFRDMAAVLQCLERYRAGTPIAELQQRTAEDSVLLAAGYPAIGRPLF